MANASRGGIERRGSIGRVNGYGGNPFPRSAQKARKLNLSTERVGRFQMTRVNSDFCHENAVEACYQYVLGRQTPEGGFCFYRYHPWGIEEPNAKDSYAAVSILKMLGRPVPHVEKCTEWLLAQQESDGGYPTLVIGHAVLKALRILGAEPLHDPCPFLREIIQKQGFTNPSCLEISGWLTNALRCVELCRDFGIAISERMCGEMGGWIGRLWCEDGGWGTPGSNLLDTGSAVELTVGLNLPVPEQALNYARRCEGLPFGFNQTPNSAASSLEVQRAGLKILGCFHAGPRTPSLIRGYVASCQTAVGGFGRTPGTIAGLSESLWAIEILSMLKPENAQAADLVGGA